MFWFLSGMNEIFYGYEHKCFDIYNIYFHIYDNHMVAWFIKVFQNNLRNSFWENIKRSAINVICLWFRYIKDIINILCGYPHMFETVFAVLLFKIIYFDHHSVCWKY